MGSRRFPAYLPGLAVPVLTITVKRGNTENQTTIDVIESSVETPVSNDSEQLLAWLNDGKKWQDVFTAKPYEYLQVIQEGKVPWYDRELGTWVDKEEYDSKHDKEKKDTEKKVKEADEEVQKSQ